jgi:hypothetical protein
VPTFLGLLLGLAAITLAFDGPLRVFHRDLTGDGGHLRSLWWTVPAAVACVAISRLAAFQPGYLYGLIVSVVFLHALARRADGMGNAFSALWLLASSLSCWLLLGIARTTAAADPDLRLVLETALACFTVAGIETLAVGLLPLRFLPGAAVLAWSKLAWTALFVPSVVAYLVILVNPTSGYLSDDSRTPMWVGVAFLVAFGILSIHTWAWFRFRGGRARAAEAGAAA